MRRSFVAAVVVALSLGLAGAARAQSGQAQAFGGLTFGDVTGSSTFGAGIAVPITDNIHIVAEGGRLTDITRPLLGTVLDFAPFGVRTSAWYGEAGVRLISSSSRAVRPYAEATAGFARLSTGVDGIGSPADDLVDNALALMNRTEPLLGVGGGVVVQGGPLVLDVGYRYKTIRAGNPVQSSLTGGDAHVSQVRVGVGFRF
jgi:opacity protein-like surface antigen